MVKVTELLVEGS